MATKRVSPEQASVVEKRAKSTSGDVEEDADIRSMLEIEEEMKSPLDGSENNQNNEELFKHLQVEALLEEVVIHPQQLHLKEMMVVAVSLVITQLLEVEQEELVEMVAVLSVQEE